MEKKPKLIIFDLDYTLWPFWVDTHVDPPFHKSARGDVVDRNGAKVKPYKEVSSVLNKLHNDGYCLGVASRTGELEAAQQLLSLWNWTKFFSHMEIYPGSKINHFKRLKASTGLSYEEMLFFDDEPRNKFDLENLGVLTILVDDGVTHSLVKKGLKKFASKNKI